MTSDFGARRSRAGRVKREWNNKHEVEVDSSREWLGSLLGVNEAETGAIYTNVERRG